MSPKGRQTPRRAGPTRAQIKRRKVALAALAVIAIVASLPVILSGVGGGGDENASDSTSTTRPGGVISPKLPDPPTLLNAQGISSDADMDSCSTDPGTVEASGTARNSGTEVADIVVAVSWVTDRSDVLARGYAVLEDVAPGATSDWDTEAELAPGQEATCVLTVNRGTLQK